MDPAYALWKTASLLSAPSNVLLLTAGLGGLWAVFVRWRGRWGSFLAACSLAGLLVCGFSPLGENMLRSLEQRFPPLEAEQLSHPPAAIIVLGGGMGYQVRRGQTALSLGEAADRVIYAAELARRFPDAPIILAGGSAFPAPNPPTTETEAMARLLTELGVAPERIRQDSRSRTTQENAREAKNLMGDDFEGEALLVTSAFHMPRAYAAFRHVGLPVMPAPTDYRVDERKVSLQWRASDALAKSDLALKEYFALVAQRLEGNMYTDPF